MEVPRQKHVSWLCVSGSPETRQLAVCFRLTRHFRKLHSSPFLIALPHLSFPPRRPPRPAQPERFAGLVLLSPLLSVDPAEKRSSSMRCVSCHACLH
jgi:hypothetical protein